MADEPGLMPEMQGSPNPLILRNYRMIPPQTWKYYNLSENANDYQGQHVYNRDIPLVFKVEAAPIVLPYESELILKFTFLTKSTDVMHRQVSNQWTPNPLYRIKGKSMAHIVKRCWATISNMTFQSYRTPFYLNEILLRKPAHQQRKYPDNYTGEKTGYFKMVEYLNDVEIPHIENPTPSSSSSYSMFLEPLNRTTPNDGQLYFMTPQFSTKVTSLYQENGVTIGNTETTLTFRIPFSELLPVFKIGVIPLIMIASNSFDMWIDLYKPADWFVDCGIGKVVALETYLNVTTVSFPDINPLAESLIRPHIYDSRFIAPFLDYLTFENNYTISPTQPEVVFFFNLNQFLRNVPFIALTFNDMTLYNQDDLISDVSYNFVDDGRIVLRGAGNASGTQDQRQQQRNNQAVANNIKVVNNPLFVTGPPRMTAINAEQAMRGGFFNLPPGVYCKDVNIMLGESAFPLTQVPMSWDDMYMYNRKHFEMYGRDFNVFRVSPIGRAHSGDASFFFDLSHSPMAGFQIGPASPIQIVGKLGTDGKRQHNIRVTVTTYYSNNFNTMLATGGVVPLQ